MTKELNALLDAVEAVVNGWCFYPDTEYGADEALIPTQLLIDLQRAYETMERKQTEGSQAVEIE